eukprot:SM008740S23665  [mRNA]  locus=s8740:7:138:- [translate_table: standard]
MAGPAAGRRPAGTGGRRAPRRRPPAAAPAGCPECLAAWRRRLRC